MNRTFLIALAGLAIAGCTSTQAAEQASSQRSGDEQAKLEQKLAGRTAEKPVSCVRMPDLTNNESVGDAILFHSRVDNVVWVNRPPAGCPMLSAGRAISVRTTSSQLCHGDIVTVFDPVSGTGWGSCGLGDFEPYRR